MAVAEQPAVEAPASPRLGVGRTTLRVALVGNPNVGKSTLFNQLTGLHQHVANWPGTTVEYAEGTAVVPGAFLELWDLPGVYGLSTHADDERAARRFLLHAAPNAVVLVVDASRLERNLFLVVETLELAPHAVVALNKVDLAAARGIAIDTSALADRLRVPVVPVVAQRGEGLDELTRAVVNVRPGAGEMLDRAELPSAVTRGLGSLVSCCEHRAGWPDAVPTDAGDSSLGPSPELDLLVADARYAWIREVVQACAHVERPSRPSWTERLDAVLLHPVFGYAWMAAIFAGVFWLAFQASAPLAEGLASALTWVADAAVAALSAAETPAWVASLLVDGIVKGIGAVLSFVPYMALFFAAMGLVETSGYMARASLLADRLMQAVGLPGRGLFPLVSAFGCNVPALTATRAMDRRRDRVVTSLVIPFIPCNARLGVMAIVSGAFFEGGTAGLVMLGLIGTSALVVGAASLAYRRTLLPTETAPLLLELPPLAVPRWQDVVIPALLRVSAFVSRIWRFLLPATVVVWTLTYFPVGAEPEDSLAGGLGGLLSPLGSLLGFDWRLMLAILFGFVAKETTLDTLGVVYGLSQTGSLASALVASMGPLTAVAFLVVYMLYVPCLATVLQMKRELGSYGWVALGVAANVVVAFALGYLVVRLGAAMGLG